MILEERVEMPTCNLAETMHNKWLRQSVIKMIAYMKQHWMIWLEPSCILRIIGHG